MILQFCAVEAVQACWFLPATDIGKLLKLDSQLDNV